MLSVASGSSVLLPPALISSHKEFSEMQSVVSDSKPALLVSTRPEIRKGCTWEITLRFSQDIIKKLNLKQIFIEKPKGRDAFYTCIKVRSKLIVPRRELGFKKVAEIENDREYIELNEHGVGTIKVKFTQRPRAVFHKHADTMILIVSLKSTKDDRILVTDEHELIFRGGTGSVHSADSRKKQIITTEIKKLNQTTTTPQHFPEIEPNNINQDSVSYSYSNSDNIPTEFVTSFPQQHSPHPTGFPTSHMTPHCEPLTPQLFENMRVEYEGSAVMNEYKDEMELYQLGWMGENGNLINTLNQAPDSNSFIHTDNDVLNDNKYFVFDNDVDSESTNSSLENSRGRKRKMDQRGSLDLGCEEYSKQGNISVGMPPIKRSRFSLEDKYYQKLFFRSLSFMTLEELRSLCAQAPVPIFVKDENSVYKWANHAFCSFILDTDSVVNKRTTELLCRTEGEEVLKSDHYLLQREGKIKTFDLLVKSQAYTVMKLYTTLRGGTKVLVGAVGTF